MAFFSPNKSFSDNLINNNNTVTSSPIFCEKTAPNTPSSLNSSKTISQVTPSSLKNPKKLSKNISSGSFFSRTKKNANRGNLNYRTIGESTFAHQDSFDSSSSFYKDSKNNVKCSSSKSADNNLAYADASFSSSFKQTKQKKRIFSIAHLNKSTSASRQASEANSNMSALSVQQHQTEESSQHPPSSLNLINSLNNNINNSVTANNINSTNQITTNTNIQNGNLTNHITPIATNAKHDGNNGSPPSPSSSEEKKTITNGLNSNNGVVALVNKNLSTSPSQTNMLAANSTSNSNTSANSNVSGYLQKWTNYIKGYQKRWFSLTNGLLSYYRSPNEMEHTCRGTINLANATISSEDLCHFVVSNGAAQTFHLKAANEVEKQKWINALELAKNKAKQYSNANNVVMANLNCQQDSDDDDDTVAAEKNELVNMLRVLQHKLNELSLSHEFVLKHSNMLNKSLNELESIQTKPDESTIKTINERSTVYKIAMLGVVNHCQEFINLASFQTRKIHKVLQSERDMRTRLEEMIQEMARQNLSIENQLVKRNTKRNGVGRGGSHVASAAQAQVKSNTNAADEEKTTSKQQSQKSNTTIQPFSESENNAEKINKITSQNTNLNSEIEYGIAKDDEANDEQDFLNDEEFHDAVEDVTQFSVTLPRQASLHQRNPSNISKMYLQESDIDSEDEDQQTIKVTMHSNKDSGSAAQANPAKPLLRSTTSITTSTIVAMNTKKTTSASDLNSLKGVSRQVKQRRKEITLRPNYSINLWSIMKNCIGKDLSKIPIPVNFSEPLSMLQRITEELEYSDLLDRAAQCEDQWEQMAYVAAFTVTAYSTTATRTNKPFNPLLNETFECDRLDDYGWRSMAEQVSHHPPGVAVHVESLKDWVFYQEFTMSSKFRGQYLQIIPLGTSHLEFKKTGFHYTWRKVATFVRNIIVGKLWIDNVGEMDIVNHKTKDVCHLKYFPYSYFSRDPPRKVTGIITDSNNVARYVLNGTWTEKMEGAPVLNPQVVTEQTQLNTGKSKVLWERRYPPAYLEAMYNYTELAVQLNEPEPNVAPTDSRLRPDQRLMEEAKWDQANQEKLRLEEKQRAARKRKEAAEQSLLESQQGTSEQEQSSLQSSSTNEENLKSDANWFQKVVDPYTKQPIHVFTNEYWDCKTKQDWKRCPDIF